MDLREPVTTPLATTAGLSATAVEPATAYGESPTASNVAAVATLTQQSPPAAPLAAARPSVPSPAKHAASDPHIVQWPCTVCGEDNDLEANLCVACGAVFLSGSDTQPSLRVPVVGDLTRLSKGMAIGVAMAGAFGLCLLFLVVMFALGKVF